MAADTALESASCESVLTPSITAVPAGDGLADLSHFGLIAVEGPEAGQFLGSLFTGDVRLVSPTQGQFTSWCDGKGRMLATFWLFMRGNTYFLLLPMALLPTTVSRLKQFLLRTKATISDASDTLARVGLSGAGVAAALGSAGIDAAAARGSTFDLDECTVVALGPAPQPRWLAVGPAGALDSVCSGRFPAAQPIDDAAWSLLDIRAGIPLLLPETSGEFIPQMVDLEALGGLSFKKGCYPGQEVVARLHYRGQLKRRMVLAMVPVDPAPPPGAKLYGPGTSESIGMVLAAAPTGPGQAAMLAVVVIEQLEQGDIRLHNAEGPRLTVTTSGADWGCLPMEG
ncbi:folate-binding protein [Methylolobus aquaticus]|nr:folate-binding protein [Methylolobus aquaticus]